MKLRLVQILTGVLGVSTIVGFGFPIAKAAITPARPEAPVTSVTGLAAHGAQHQDRRHMHMRNWALEPTGMPGVSPLDPTTIPKYVNELTKPPVFVPDNPGRSPLHYTVTSKAIRQQLLPPGFPDTEVYAYGGRVEFPNGDQRTAFSTPGPTFEAVRGAHIRVHYRNQLEGNHIFPVDPTIMFANPNNIARADAAVPALPARLRPRAEPDPGRDPSARRRHAVRVGRLRGCVVHEERREKGSGLHHLHLRLLQRAIGHDALVSRPHPGHDAAQRRRRPGGHLPRP